MQIVTTHVNTDFDALASVIAATILYPGSTPILPKNLNPNVKAFLSIHKDLLGTVSAKRVDLDEIAGLIKKEPEVSTPATSLQVAGHSMMF